MQEFDRIVEEIEGQHPGDVARAKSLLRRSDALSYASVYVGDAEEDGNLDPEATDEIVEVLEVMLEEVDGEFGRARQRSSAYPGHGARGREIASGRGYPSLGSGLCC